VLDADPLLRALAPAATGGGASATFRVVSTGRLGLLVGLAVVVVAIAIGAITTSAVWMLILSWALLLAVVGWAVVAVYERRRRHTD
jgi:hypothetical protein